MQRLGHEAPEHLVLSVAQLVINVHELNYLNTAFGPIFIHRAERILHLKGVSTLQFANDQPLLLRFLLEFNDCQRRGLVQFKGLFLLEVDLGIHNDCVAADGRHSIEHG